MITNHIFETVLVDPAKRGADKLFVASGYATAAMAFHHLQFLRNINKSIELKLIVGMCVLDGLSRTNHKGFQQLMQLDFKQSFECSYLTNTPAVHSKVYAWFRGDNPICAFAGSANYTQTAFGAVQREVMTVCDPSLALSYYKSLVSETVFCVHPEADSLVEIYNDRYYEYLKRVSERPEAAVPSAIPSGPIGLPNVRVSLLGRSGKVEKRSGLNWGQRPEEHREPNQAYIALRSEIYRSSFFPKREIHFTVLTDDNKVLICTRAQDNGKAIHTPHNNSLIGEYFRNRLGVRSGAPVTSENLSRYGRTHVDFYKIDDETYYMDFSVPVNG